MPKKFRQYPALSSPLIESDVFLVSRSGDAGSQYATAAEVKVFADEWEPGTVSATIRPKLGNGVYASVAVFGEEVAAQGLLHVHQGSPLLRVEAENTLIQSTTVSAADSVLLTLNSVNAWTQGRLLSVKNAGVDKFFISPTGGIVIGANTISYTGVENGSSLLSFRDTDLGEPNSNSIWIGTMASGTDVADIRLAVSSGVGGGASFAMGSSHGGWIFESNDGTLGGAKARGTASGQTRVLLFPGAISTQSPYLFDTGVEHTDIDVPLVVIGNGGVEKAAFDIDGKLSIQEAQVLGTRVVDARVDDAINAGAWDATTAGVLESLRDAAVTHGWIKAV